MAVTEVHLAKGGALERMVSFTAILPEGKPGPFPVLYLLHGGGDDHTAWVRRSSIERHADKYPMIIVMPNGEMGWYTDSKAIPHSKFETFIAKDLVSFVDNTFATVPTRAGRAIAGLSMGGYGTLKLAIKHPDVYCAAYAMSASTTVSNRDGESSWDVEYRLKLGDRPVGGPEDIFYLYEHADRSTIPALTFNCGVDDFLLEDNRRLHNALTEMKFPHSYTEYAGAHTWDYWDTHIQDGLAWLAPLLGIAPRAEKVAVA